VFPLCIHGDYTHTHWIREPQLPAGKCWHQRGPRLVPRAHTRLTHSASCPQRNKGDFTALLKSFGFGYVPAPPYMDLLRTGLSSITEVLRSDPRALGMLRAAQYFVLVGKWDRMSK